MLLLLSTRTGALLVDLLTKYCVGMQSFSIAAKLTPHLSTLLHTKHVVFCVCVAYHPLTLIMEEVGSVGSPLETTGWKPRVQLVQ